MIPPNTSNKDDRGTGVSSQRYQTGFTYLMLMTVSPVSADTSTYCKAVAMLLPVNATQDPGGQKFNELLEICGQGLPACKLPRLVFPFW